MFKELKNNTSKLSETDNRIKEDSRIKQSIEKSLDKTLTEKSEIPKAGYYNSIKLVLSV